MDEPEMKEVASIVGDVLRHPGDDPVAVANRARVTELVARFPAYPR
jgi:glycine/serine hydroxymethyltransferase